MRIKQDVWKCYVPNYKRKTWEEDPAGEWVWGPRSLTSGYLSFGVYISRRGTCEEISGAYEKTDTDGKFLYHKPSKLNWRHPPQLSPLC